MYGDVVDETECQVAGAEMGAVGPTRQHIRPVHDIIVLAKPRRTTPSSIVTQPWLPKKPWRFRIRLQCDFRRQKFPECCVFVGLWTFHPEDYLFLILIMIIISPLLYCKFAKATNANNNYRQAPTTEPYVILFLHFAVIRVDNASGSKSLKLTQTKELLFIELRLKKPSLCR